MRFILFFFIWFSALMTCINHSSSYFKMFGGLMFLPINVVLRHWQIILWWISYMSFNYFAWLQEIFLSIFISRIYCSIFHLEKPLVYVGWLPPPLAHLVWFSNSTCPHFAHIWRFFLIVKGGILMSISWLLQVCSLCCLGIGELDNTLNHQRG